MKNILLITFFLALNYLSAQDAKKLTGEWKGSYFCLQGETGLTLKIKGLSNGKIKGRFIFYPISENDSRLVKSGSFSFTGELNSNTIIIAHKKWIDKPENYMMIDLGGYLIDNETIEGESLTKKCGKFRLKKVK